MGDLLLTHSERLVRWAEAITGRTYASDARAIGRGDGETIRAAIVYDRFGDLDCHIHVASDGTGHWLTKRLLAAGAYYPFVICNRRRITAPIDSTNARAIALVRHMGFVLEGRMRLGTRHGDLLIFGMTRPGCRFIPPEFRTDPLGGKHGRRRQ